MIPFVVAGGYRDRRTGELKMNKDDPGHLTRFHPDGSSKAGADYNISQKDAAGAHLAAGGGEASDTNIDYSRQLDQFVSNYEMGVGDNSGEGFHPRGPR